MFIQGDFGHTFYDADEKLGEGTCAVVYKGTYTQTGKKEALPCAVKVFKERSSLKDELDVFITLKKAGGHPNIVSFFDHSTGGITLISMGLFGTKTLHAVISEDDRTPMRAIGKITGQLVDAVAFLNGKQKIFHGDLKSDNVLVDGRYDIKVTDFSNSRNLDVLGLAKKRMCASAFAAPSAFLGRPHGDTEDMWAVAVIIYMLTTKCYFLDISGIVRERTKTIDPEINALEAQWNGERHNDVYTQMNALYFLRNQVKEQTDDATQAAILAAQRAHIGEEAPKEWMESSRYPEDRPKLTKTDWGAHLAKQYQELDKGQKITNADQDILKPIGEMFDLAVRWKPVSAEKIQDAIGEDLRSAAAKSRTVSNIAQAALLALIAFVGNMVIKGD